MENICDPNVWSKFYVGYDQGMIWVYKLVNGEYEAGARVGLSTSMGKTWCGTKMKLRRLCDVADRRAEDMIYANREQFGLFYDGDKDPFANRSNNAL